MNTKKEAFKRILKKINKAENIVLFPHENMDGDAVGSCKALALALRSMGKKCFIYGEAEIPDYVSFLSGEEFIDNVDFDIDLAMLVDCGLISRIKGREDVFNSAKDFACLDHHEVSCDVECVFCDPSAAACAIVVKEFIDFAKCSYTEELASAVYTGIVTDTGGFRFSNTDNRALTTAADLLQYGVKPSEICSRVFENKPVDQTKIEALAMSRMEFFADGKGVISYITPDELERFGGKYEYCETSIDRLREISGVEIACFLKPRPDCYKASIRAKSYADVASVAAIHGGGGHIHAAGCTMTGPIDDILKILTEELTKAL